MPAAEEHGRRRHSRTANVCGLTWRPIWWWRHWCGATTAIGHSAWQSPCRAADFSAQASTAARMPDGTGGKNASSSVARSAVSAMSAKVSSRNATGRHEFVSRVM